MAYRLKRGESLCTGIKRIATEQIDRAVNELRDQNLERPKQIHQVRKRCKKLRGLVRLTRPAFEATYAKGNAWFRDTARLLSPAREAKTRIDTYDTLMDHFRDQLNRQSFGSIRSRLTHDRKKQLADETDADKRCDTALERLPGGRERIEFWSLDGNELDAWCGGMQKTYDRARKTMRQAFYQPDSHHFHEWRKRVKYHGYHCRLLENIWPAVMNARIEEAGKLDDYLGNEHDLAVLRQRIRSNRDDFGRQRDIDAFLALLQQRRQRLQRKAATLGERLFAEKPGAISKRFACYWRAFR